MVSSKEVELRDKELRIHFERLSTFRDNERSVYNSDYGRKALMRLIRTGKLFDRISSNEGEIAIHNLIVGICEECGFFDETNLEKIVNFLFTLPLVDRNLDNIGGN